MNGNKQTDAVSATETDTTKIKPQSSNVNDEVDTATHRAATNGNSTTNHGDGDSEAETLIDSPVKRKEAAKRQQYSADSSMKIKVESNPKAETHPTAQGSEDEDITTNKDAGVNGEMSDDLDDLSDQDKSASASSSRASSRSRAASELPDASHTSPNPRKRKHRASSVSLPSKRQSVETSRRRLRATTHDDEAVAENDRSDSPRSRTHRRAVSTQSFLDGSAEVSSSRKRRGGAHFSSRESKSARWEESSVSSEATSHGHNEHKRQQRGVGRATIGVGRPVGREHKRHVNKYGYTRLAEACESGDLDAVKDWRTRDPEQLELAEYAENKPLQIAALNGNVEVVEYLISQGCQTDCANAVGDTPLIDAAENGHLDVVRVLLKAGVDPLRQNNKGQQAIDVVQDDTDNVVDIRGALQTAIEAWNSDDAKQRREEEEERRYRAGPAKELHLMSRTYENLHQLVTRNDRNGVREFLDARVPVDNAIIAAAAKTGDLYLMNMLLAEMPEKKRTQKAEKPMLSVIGTSHFEMVKSLTELDQFNPMWTNRQGKKWSEIAEERAGPSWRQEVELLRNLERQAADKQVDRRSSSPIMRRSDTVSGKHKRASVGEDSDHDGSDEDMLDDDDTPRRKNGRRLFSKKDMQAAASKRNDKGDADSDLDDDNSEGEPAGPTSPKEKRGPGRPRTKGSLAKHEDLKEQTRVADQRRKSSSTKHAPAADKAVNGANHISSAQDDLDMDDVAGHNNTAEAEETTRLQAEAQLQLAAEQEQAQKELLRQNEMEEQRRRAAEEQERERQRQLEIAAVNAARSKTRQELLSLLPDQISWLLNPASDFSYEEVDAGKTILQICEPVQAVYACDLDQSLDAGATGEPLVLNIAIAPLLGRSVGLQLLLPDDAMDPTVRDTLTSYELLPGRAITDTARKLLDPLLLNTNLMEPSRLESTMANGVGHGYVSKEQASTNMAERLQALQKLTIAPLALRWIPLQRVVDRLHPVLHAMNIITKEDWRNHLNERLAVMSRRDVSDGFKVIAAALEQAALPYTVRHGQIVTEGIVRNRRDRQRISVKRQAPSQAK